jgi:1,3-beta-galactosyl-N-acetylhexosamine phosphorylase
MQTAIEHTFGRLTIPTDRDVTRETLALAKAWGADAIRDADGTVFPPELAAAAREAGAKVYATYYTTRKDNDWARAHPEEVQQCYVMTGFHTAFAPALSIALLAGFSGELLAVNERDSVSRWWEVIDRTTGEVVPHEEAAPAAGAPPLPRWRYERAGQRVVIEDAQAGHEYTVSFLCYLIWDPVHMYNATVNGWKEGERQITFDVRQSATRAWSKERLRAFLRKRPYVDVVRFTTFFHQFTLVFDELRRSKYVDWYGYSASVSPPILEQFEREVGYRFRPEFIIDEGYYNGQYRIPSKEFLDFQAFQRREVAALARELVAIVHEEGREAMMFLGDHWIGTEPYMDEFRTIGLDAVVGSVGNGATLRLIADIEGVSYTEGRFLPYFFPDTFHAGGDPLGEARQNWVTARRAILRRPIDRIGYGGYLKLVLDFPDFVAYVKTVADEFRAIYARVKGDTGRPAAPYCAGRVAVLNCWGRARSWGCHMVHHALYEKENYSYAGVLECLSGAAFDVSFISFDDIKNNGAILDTIDVILNIGNADTAHGGGPYWSDPVVLERVRLFIARGGGFIGVGEPSAHQHNGHFFQLAGALGVEKETGFTLGCGKYNKEVRPHFITEGLDAGAIDFGEGAKGVYALPQAEVLALRDGDVQLAASAFGRGRAVYLSGLPYSFANSRLLHRALLWAASAEDRLHVWYSGNPAVEVHAYPERGLFCVVNNAFTPQETTVYQGDGASFAVSLDGAELRWYDYFSASCS